MNKRREFFIRYMYLKKVVINLIKANINMKIPIQDVKSETILLKFSQVILSFESQDTI